MRRRVLHGPRAALLLLAACAHQTCQAAQPAAPCDKPVYLTVDPAQMEFAPRLADMLRRQQVAVTFWVSNLLTQNGEGSLGNQWGTWWKQVAQQGHDFASQTYDFAVWRGDLPGYKPRFRVRPASGAFAGREFTYEPAKYCEQIEHATRRIEDFTGKRSLPLFHPPSGAASTKLLAAASACGYAPVTLPKAAVLGTRSLQAELAAIRAGDTLLLDLHAPAGSQPWALENAEPLLAGLKERGLCFASLRQHPGYQAWISGHGG